MKDIDRKDTPEVSGGYVPPSNTGGGCFPWPEDPTEPQYPQGPMVPGFDPVIDPVTNR